MSAHEGDGDRSHRLRPMILVSTVLLLAASSFVAPSMAGADGFSSKGAEQIFRTAVADSAAASSFSVRGEIRQPKMDLTLNLSLSASGMSEGTLSINGGNAQIREIAGTGYFKGDTAFWTSSANAATARLFAGKWIYAPLSNALFSGFRSFFSPRTFIKSFFGTDHGPYRKNGTKLVNGKRTVGVMSDGPGTMYVATNGTHVIVSVQGSEAGALAKLSFGSYGVAVHPVEPTGAVSLESLQNAVAT